MDVEQCNPHPVQIVRDEVFMKMWPSMSVKRSDDLVTHRVKVRDTTADDVQFQGSWLLWRHFPLSWRRSRFFPCSDDLLPHQPTPLFWSWRLLATVHHWMRLFSSYKYSTGIVSPQRIPSKSQRPATTQTTEIMAKSFKILLAIALMVVLISLVSAGGKGRGN